MKHDKKDETLAPYTGPSAPSSMKFMSDEEEKEGDIELVKEYFRLLVNEERSLQEIVRRCGKNWCLYSKHKKNGKRRRLGTHPSKAAAYRQERAIKAHGG